MAKKKKLVKLVLLKTVAHQGKHYAPDTFVEWEVDIAEDLIEKEAAEPCMDIMPDPDA